MFGIGVRVILFGIFYICINKNMCENPCDII